MGYAGLRADVEALPQTGEQARLTGITATIRIVPPVRKVLVTRQLPVCPDPAWFMDARLPVNVLLTAALLLSLALPLILPFGLAAAQTADPPAPSVPPLSHDEEVAQGIDRMLMCPVCAGQSIDQSQAQIARQMRRLVREMLAQGASREEVLDFFVERYGPEVLAAPPKSGLNLLAWIVPVVVVLAALGAGVLVIRSMADTGAWSLETEPPVEDDLAPYLEVIDREAGIPVAATGQDATEPGQTGEPPEDQTAGGIPELPREEG